MRNDPLRTNVTEVVRDGSVRRLERREQASDPGDREHVAELPRILERDEAAVEDPLLGRLRSLVLALGPEHPRLEDEVVALRHQRLRRHLQTIELHALVLLRRLEERAVGVARRTGHQLRFARTTDLLTDLLTALPLGSREVVLPGIEEAARHVQDLATLIVPRLLDDADVELPADDGVWHDHRTAAAVLVEAPPVVPRGREAVGQNPELRVLDLDDLQSVGHQAVDQLDGGEWHGRELLRDLDPVDAHAPATLALLLTHDRHDQTRKLTHETPHTPLAYWGRSLGPSQTSINDPRPCRGVMCLSCTR